jgi:ABC-type ATPase with predicted acetyltransferase domain
MLIRIDKKIERKHKISKIDNATMRMFGLTEQRLNESTCKVKCQFEINEGEVVYITGPSGSGKSVLMRELEKAIQEKERINLSEVELAEDRSVIDSICESMDIDLIEGLKLLSIAGLADAFCVLNKPVNLSEGQQYRYRLAMAMARKKQYIIADEFCSVLDRITASVISYNIHKYSKRTGTIFILASSHTDVLQDLWPDVLITRELSGQTWVTRAELN